jgi:D-hydroxyproline dehydrogenase subunit gamma
MSRTDLRIHDGVARGVAIRFRFDGDELDAFAGESVAAALWASGIRGWSTAGAEGPPARTVFCAMGVCQQCAVWIDGVRVEACRTPVRAGLDVRTRT